MVFDRSACQFAQEEQPEGEGILTPKEKSRMNVPDLSGQNSEVKAASSPLVQGPVNQSRDQDSPACDDSSISIGAGGCVNDRSCLLDALDRPA